MCASLNNRSSQFAWVRFDGSRFAADLSCPRAMPMPSPVTGRRAVSWAVTTDAGARPSQCSCLVPVRLPVQAFEAQVTSSCSPEHVGPLSPPAPAQRAPPAPRSAPRGVGVLSPTVASVTQVRVPASLPRPGNAVRPGASVFSH